MFISASHSFSLVTFWLWLCNFLAQKYWRSTVNFINVFWAHFLHKCRFGSFFYVHVTRKATETTFVQKTWEKKVWWNWPQVRLWSHSAASTVYQAKIFLRCEVIIMKWTSFVLWKWYIFISAVWINVTQSSGNRYLKNDFKNYNIDIDNNFFDKIITCHFIIIL